MAADPGHQDCRPAGPLKRPGLAGDAKDLCLQDLWHCDIDPPHESGKAATTWRSQRRG
ncbi:hypothetical protein MES5069_30071 [Mesorhizobium escarrei]|uniref:Uncharacterized protein n=1 Tax=Mesorhizobium escarrei TaxID=666018 RepID=A0ABN8JVV1_9HYPH|nr:hypothetical protein MES5069_30071 [Mesorhizobium escarrei]